MNFSYISLWKQLFQPTNNPVSFPETVKCALITEAIIRETVRVEIGVIIRGPTKKFSKWLPTLLLVEGKIKLSVVKQLHTLVFLVDRPNEMNNETVPYIIF